MLRARCDWLRFGNIMHFAIPVHRPLLLSIAAAHGVTDVARPPSQLIVYAMALLPLPGWLTSGAFGIASVMHFASDMGGAMSLLMHATWAALARYHWALAFESALWYICAVHIPMLFQRASLTVRTVLLIGTLVAIVHGPNVLVENGTFHLSHRLQRIVACHVWLDVVM